MRSADLKIERHPEITEINELIIEHYLEYNPEFHARAVLDELQKQDEFKTAMLWRSSGSAEWNEEPVSYNPNSTNYTSELRIAEFEEGNYELKFRLTDEDGTEAETEIETLNIIHDHVKPEVILFSPDSYSKHRGADLEIAFTDSDNVGVKKYKIMYSQDGTEYTEFPCEIDG